jgi:nicotinamidase-related amidase
MKVQARGAALVIIDMQTALVNGAWREPETLAALAGVIAKARESGVPVLFVVHNHASFKPMMKGQPGWQIHADLKLQAQDSIVEKTASDAFYQTPLAARLRSLEVDTLLIGGMQSEYCVDASARSALNHGFDVVLLSDCHTTGDGALPAADIIAHHNLTLPNLVHPDHSIRLAASMELEFLATE